MIIIQIAIFIGNFIVIYLRTKAALFHTVFITGIEAARSKYREIADKVPHCKQLHVAMARIESLEMDPDIDQWEKVIELAIQQFNDHLDLWKMSMELYLRQHKVFEKKRPGFDLSGKLLEVYNKAERSLKHNELLLANLKKEFDDLRNSIDL